MNYLPKNQPEQSAVEIPTPDGASTAEAASSPESDVPTEPTPPTAEELEHGKAAMVDTVASILERVASFIRRHPAAVCEFVELVGDAQAIGLGVGELLTHGAGL